MRWLSREQRLIFIGAFFSGMGFAPFRFMQPLYVAYLGASPAQIGQALGLSGLASVFFFIPLSQQAEWLGRKRMIVLGWGLSAAATLAMALAPDWRWLIPALMLYQLSVFAMPAFYAYLSESNRDGNPNRLFATIASASNAGVVVSPFIAGWLAEHAGLRLVYVYSALLFGVATLAFSRIPEQELGTREKRIPVRQLSRDRWFMVEMVYIFLFFLVIDVGQVMVPNYLSEVHHVSLMQIGQLGSVGAIGLLLLTLLLGRIPAERRDALLFTQILALAALVLWAGLPTGLGIAVAYLIHGGNRLAVPLFSGRLAFFLPSRLRNLGFGFRETAMRLSFAIGPFLAGWLYDFHPSWPLLVSMAGLIIAMLLTLLLPAPNNSLSTDHYAPGPLPTRVRK